MKKWSFRSDMLFHYINGCSERTFQDAEDRLNLLEEKFSSVLDDLKNLKKCYNGDENAIIEPINYGEYIQEIIDKLEKS